MTKTFVTLNDPVHSLIRGVTRHTPLRAGLSADQRLMVQYSFQEKDLPEAYYSLGLFHSVGGLPIETLRRTRWRARASDKAEIPARVNYFDAVKLDRRCARDLRLKLKRHGPGLLSGDLLCFGVGMLRAASAGTAGSTMNLCCRHRALNVFATGCHLSRSTGSVSVQ